LATCLSASRNFMKDSYLGRWTNKKQLSSPQNSYPQRFEWENHIARITGFRIEALHANARMIHGGTSISDKHHTTLLNHPHGPGRPQQWQTLRAQQRSRTKNVESTIHAWWFTQASSFKYFPVAFSKDKLLTFNSAFVDVDFPKKEGTKNTSDFGFNLCQMNTWISETLTVQIKRRMACCHYFPKLWQ